MSLKRINSSILERVDKNQKDLKKSCDSIIEKIALFTNSAEYSPFLSVILPELKTLVEVTKEGIDFTRSGFDIFLSEIKALDRRIDELEKSTRSNK